MKDKQIILFDGVCNLCNSSVNFVIDRDKKDKFLFGALQSEEGEALLKKMGEDPKYLDSIVLLKNGQLYHKSTAALHVAGELPGLWPLLKVFILIPRFLRDPIYDFIAKNRYSWFGKRDTCRMPGEDLKAKFLSPQTV